MYWRVLYFTENKYGDLRKQTALFTTEAAANKFIGQLNASGEGKNIELERGFNSKGEKI